MPDLGGIVGNIVDKIKGHGGEQGAAGHSKPPGMSIPPFIKPYLPEWFTSLPVEKQTMYFQMLVTAFQMLQNSGAMGGHGGAGLPGALGGGSPGAHGAGMPGGGNVGFGGFSAPAQGGYGAPPPPGQAVPHTGHGTGLMMAAEAANQVQHHFHHGGGHMSPSTLMHGMPSELASHGVTPDMWKQLAMSVGTELQKAQHMQHHA